MLYEVITERLAMFRMSAGMGFQFAQTAKDMTEKIRELGPSPINVATAQLKGKAA